MRLPLKWVRRLKGGLDEFKKAAITTKLNVRLLLVEVCKAGNLT